MKIKKRRVIFLLALVMILLAAGFWYVNDYYRSEVSIADYQNSREDVVIKEIKEGLYLDGPGEDTAMVFYPGAKVEYTAYIPLFYELAEQGVDCFLVKMPCNLAIFGLNKADKIIDQYEYSHWYLSGHSLGGAMAASYTSDNLDKLEGLVLLAGYPTKSLQADDLLVLSLYGSEDGVLNLQKVEEGRAYMPEDYTEICIEGGNHAGFAEYGEQKGDKPAAISSEEQQKQTVAAILEWIPSIRVNSSR